MNTQNIAANASSRSVLRFAEVLGSAFLTALCLLPLAPKASAQVTYALTNVWFVPTNVLSSSNLIINGDNTRSLAYDINSNQVFVCSGRGGLPAPGIQVLDGATGTSLGLLNTNGVSGGGIAALNMVAVAADGVIYAANWGSAVTNTSPYKIYRWANWLDTNLVVAYAGDPHTNAAGFVTANRIGDTLTATGSGTNTKILAGLGSAQTTNMLLFTTTDGTNFSPHILAIAGLPTGTGVAYGFTFYTNNTFLVRANGAAGNPLSQVLFPANIGSLGAGPIAGTIIASPAFSVANSTAMLDYKAQSGFLAAISPVNSAPSTAPVSLYLDPVVGNGACPILAATTNYPHTAANGNITGAVALGGAGYAQYIFSLDCNNGVRCSAVTTISAQPPTISTPPVGITANAYPPYTLSVVAAGFCPLIYQWQATNNAGGFTNIPGATASSYVVATPSTNYYRVVITNTINSVTSAAVQVSLLAPTINSAVTNLWRVAAGTSGYSYLSASDNNTRGIAYDTNTHRVVVAGTSGLFILNGDNGTNVAGMSLTGVTFSGALSGADQVGIADDGAVYAGNLIVSFSASGNYKLYRWGAPTNTATAVPAFSGDPGSGSIDRWGDTMAVRGAGADTQILLGSGSGTNVALLTTSDGTNFSSTLLAISGVPTSFAAKGIAFGTNNSFWAKNYLGDLFEITFDPVAQIGTVVFDYHQPSQIPGTMSGVGLDPNNNILAGIQLSDTPNDMQLFQLTGTSDAPVLFHQGLFASANANGNENVAMTMKFPRVYGLDVNNGLLALSYGVPATTAPTINTPPASQTVYTNDPVLVMSVSAVGSLPIYYQWQSSASTNAASFANITGATNSTYTLNYPQTTASGFYRVVVHNIAGFVTSSPPALLSVIAPVTSSVVTQLWSLAGGSRSYLDSSSYSTRGLAYDPSTTNLVVCDHFTIYVLSATDGSDQGFTLTTAGLPNGGVNGWLVDQLGVADDGVVYACNLADPNFGSVNFAITSWSAVSMSPMLNSAYGGTMGADPGSGSGDRWGDNMSVRGAGTNTQILISSQTSNVVLFTTSDGINFTPQLITVTNAPAGFAGTGIAFGQSNTFWSVGGTGYNLRQVAYDTKSATGLVIENYVTSAGTDQALPFHLGGVGVDAAANILGSVVTRISDTPPDVRLYQLSGNVNPPALLDQVFFASVNDNAQEDAVVTLKGGLGFALNVNNGIVAFSYGVPSAPAFSIASVGFVPGTGTTLTWPAFNGRTYQAQYATALQTSGTLWGNIGPAILATNTPISFTDTTATNAARYYRVQAH